MHPAPRRSSIALALALALVIMLAALALTVAACSPPQPAETGTGIAPVPTSSLEPTAPPQEVPVVSAGPIRTPAIGTALRAAILEAASTGLGFGGQPTVIQLFSQGTAAVGDIQPADGSRMFFAVTGGPDEWSIAWSAASGSSLANLADLQASAPLVSPELAASLSWTKKAPKSPAKAPTLSSFKTFAMASATDMAGATYTGTFTISAKIAKDSIGVWWGSAIAEPSEEGLESIGVWGRYSGGKWTGEIADFSSEDGAVGFFPADVLDKLAL